MTLISLVMTLIVIGLILYLIGFLPLDGKIKQLINAVVIVVVILWLLGMLVGGLGQFHFPR